jgi:hypothetical protein
MFPHQRRRPEAARPRAPPRLCVLCGERFFSRASAWAVPAAPNRHECMFPHQRRRPEAARLSVDPQGQALGAPRQVARGGGSEPSQVHVPAPASPPRSRSPFCRSPLRGAPRQVARGGGSEPSQVHVPAPASPPRSRSPFCRSPLRGAPRQVARGFTPRFPSSARLRASASSSSSALRASLYRRTRVGNAHHVSSRLDASPPPLYGSSVHTLQMRVHTP